MIDFLWLFIFIPLDIVMANEMKTRHVMSINDWIVVISAILLGSFGILILIRLIMLGKYYKYCQAQSLAQDHSQNSIFIFQVAL